MNKVKSLLSVVLSCVVLQLRCQLLETFSDGNFDRDPEWTVSTISGGPDFQVSEQLELHSDGPDQSATIWIGLQDEFSGLLETYRWEFKVRYLNAPSITNNIRIYVSSDQLNPDETEGYYIQLGESGSDDGIDFFSTVSATPLIEDATPRISDGIDHTVRLDYSDGAGWQLYSKSGLEDFGLIGESIDLPLNINPGFIIAVQHTSSRSESFVFDDILLPYKDRVAPLLIRSEWNNSDLVLEFNEAIGEESALDVRNYELDGVGPPSFVSRLGPNTVMLSFTDELTNATFYTLAVDGIKDLTGNTLEGITIEIFYFIPAVPQFKDIVITEIMADPSPPLALPEVEYIELYNASTKYFDLDEFEIADATRSSELENYILGPNGYVVLIPDEKEQFGNSIPLIEIANWPSLNNGGDEISLSYNGTTVDQVNYSSSWYGQDFTGTGGVSLERIDLNNQCNSANNWLASTNERGGTPGEQNSVFRQIDENDSPELVEVFVLAPDSLLVIFSEPIFNYDGVSVEVLDNPLTAEFSSDSVLLVQLQSPLNRGNAYTLKVQNIIDCYQNENSDLFKEFRVPDLPQVGDLVLNEILFNPFPGGEDFVELYNASNHYLDLTNLYIANGEKHGEQLIIGDQFQITSSLVPLAPGQYFAITENVAPILQDYIPPAEANIVELPRIPSFPDEAGVAVLLLNDEVIDTFSYSEELHSSLLDDTEGVSLERLDPLSDNWYSASASVGYASPGYQNSLQIAPSNSGARVSINPKLIVPNGDGRDDLMTINYNFDASSKLATVTVFDLDGRQVKQLANNTLISGSGYFIWDGTNSSGEKGSVGLYILLFEWYDADGNSGSLKKTIAIGG